MFGAMVGDVVGSVYEWDRIKTVEFPLFGPGSEFTDDTVLTVATAHAILHRAGYARAYKDFGLHYPGRGYGGSFVHWLARKDDAPYNSWGNGSAMRVSPVGFAFDSVDAVLAEAQRTAEVTHNHPEGIKGAQATALAVYLARTGRSKEEIRKAIAARFGYDLNRRLDDIRPHYQFDESCQGTVPEAIIAFLESTDFEDAIRKAVSLGGDSDTLACIASGIAQAFYKHIPAQIVTETEQRLPQELLAVVSEFNQRYNIQYQGAP
ncbi:MAG: ADP-ribosylglycohydrolase family protein [Phycisphaerae bacterium]|nr:ADP-ribosylglycohydrolase family protein [Phycisphaerae bacterium]